MGNNYLKFILVLIISHLSACIQSSYLSANSFSSNLQHLANQKNLSHLEKEWLVKATIPEYVRDYIFEFESVSERKRKELFGGVSSSCEAHLSEWFTRLGPAHWDTIGQEENKWVLQMIDAWGKIPEGILTGHTTSYGDFDECVEVEVSKLEYKGNVLDRSREFDGNYCFSYILDYNTVMAIIGAGAKRESIANFHANHISSRSGNQTIQEAVSLEELLKMLTGKSPVLLPPLPSVGLCFPNSCSQAEIQQVLLKGVMEFYSKIPGVNPTVLPFPYVISCTDRHKPDFSTGAIVMIIVLVVLVTLALSAAVADYWLENYDKSKSKKKLGSNKAFQCFMAFSAYTNTKKLLGTKTGASDLGCLHGLRFLSMAWVVLAHTYGKSVTYVKWNLIDVNNVWKDWTQLAVINGTFSVDTFFVMSGLLATYNILKMLDKTGGKFNVILFYIHRYIRITPTYAIIIGVTATLFTYLGNGPQWVFSDATDEFCKKNWWTNLLYINNIVNPDEMCNGESWYLANDMQFYILSPFIVYPLWKSRKLGVALLTVYTILSCIAPVLVVHYRNQPPAAIISRPGPDSNSPIYHRPWSRISTFLVGVWMGWILHLTRNHKIKLSWIVVVCGWVASTAIALALLFAIHPWYDQAVEIPKVAGYFYAGMGRFSWGVVIAWIIFACLKGYGGIVNKFLSWKAFVPLGRLCFCMYLTSGHVQTLLHGRLNVPIKWDDYTTVNIYFAHLVMSSIVAFFATLLFESPFMILHKLLFEGLAARGNEKGRVRIEDLEIVPSPEKVGADVDLAHKDTEETENKK